MAAAARTVADFADIIVRRYCACGQLNRCTCGLPRPSSGWTVGRLAELRTLRREGFSLEHAAFQVASTPQRCNIALNALVGRTPGHALAVLERQAKNGLAPVKFDDEREGWAPCPT